MPAPLTGTFTVEESAALLRHYRYAAERMMRVLGGWIALTPELSAKLLLGRQVWDSAQHADVLGRRLLELRSPAQVSEPSGPGFVAFLDELEQPVGAGETVERLVGIYRVLKPHLLAAYEHHLAQANPVYEPPTRRILARCVEDERRHISAGETVLRHLITSPARRERAGVWQGRLEGRLVASGGVTGRGLPPPSGFTPVPDPEAQEFIRLEQSSSPRGVPDELLSALEHLGDALLRGDPSALELWGAGGMPAEEFGVPAGDFTAHRVVALARLGHQYVAKLRLEGPGTSAVLLTRWAQAGGSWRVVAAEVVRVEAAPSP